MKKLISFFSLFAIFNLLSLILNPGAVNAAPFIQSYIRVDQQKTATQTTGMVCAEPQGAGIEGSLEVTFPNTFAVSGVLSNWTVSTANLPSDATIWPGIGTATSVSGKTVRFPSSDLTIGTLYCFTWTKKQALTTGAVGQQDNAGITTKTLGAVTIDSKTFPLYTSENNELSVSASVEPFARSAELGITGRPDVHTTLTQDQELSIHINYKHYLPESYPMDIVVEWEPGIIDVISKNSIDMFTYVVGSATNADDGTIPIVDVTNKKVVWHIPPFSSDKNHELSFKLKVRGDILTDSKITARIKAYGRFVNSALPERALVYTIKRSVPPPTPTPTPSITQYIPLRFTGVTIDEIADTYFNASFQTNKVSTYSLNYGESPSTLNKQITGLAFLAKHKVKVSDLKPDTQYYFRVTARDRSGNSITSDFFTVTTASGKETIKLAREDFTVHWGKYFLISQAVNTVVLPKNKPVTITTRITDSANISKIKAIFSNEKVLGLNNMTAPQANIGETPLIEILPGVFSGEIQSPSQKGVYSIAFEITDVNGGFYKKQAPYTFYVSDPLRVIDQKSKKPIENAEVKITKYQDSLKLFASLKNSFAIFSKTTENGELDIVLPTGVYDIEVKADQYKSETRKVELGISTVDYPVFELEKKPTIQNLTSYYTESLNDLYAFTGLTAHSFFTSQRAKDLYVIFTFILLLLLIVLDTHIKKRLGLLSKLITFSILDVFVLLTGVTTLLFIKYLGVSDTAFLIAITLFIFILGLVYVRKTFFKNKIK